MEVAESSAGEPAMAMVTVAAAAAEFSKVLCRARYSPIRVLHSCGFCSSCREHCRG